MTTTHDAPPLYAHAPEFDDMFDLTEELIWNISRASGHTCLNRSLLLG
jgi:hypothetical protein